MENSQSERYKEAGVDINAGYEAVRRMRQHVERTSIPGVLGGLGGFGGMFAPDVSGMEQPVLVSGTDGVGTKLKIAFLLDKHDTVGIDCVAMCVNDIICSGAKPLFFLDYIACGRNDPGRIEAIVAGIAEGCVQAGCALVGGETAEMPGFYPEDEYDLAGFSVGLVDKSRLLNTENVRPGDVVLGLPSSGLHSNGFSLVRSVLGLNEEEEKAREILSEPLDESHTIGNALLEPTRIYVKPVLELLNRLQISGAAHITGGGFYENLPRMLPPELGVQLCGDLPEPPAIFGLIAERGRISRREMYSTFNMGVGFALALRPQNADQAMEILHRAGEAPFLLGEVVESEQGVLF